ncbi:hypothetical protein R3P38DRAFT_3442894, partial [Favolaschia claudopus]
MPAFCAQLDAGVNGVALTKWKQETANDILASPLFAGKLDVSNNSQKAWHEIVVRKFTNYRTQVYLKKADSTVAPSPKHRGVPLLHFSTLLTAWQLFAKENESVIHSAAEERHAAAGTGTVGSAYQTVLKEKWDTLDSDARDERQTRADKFGGDIHRSKTFFRAAMHTALATLCQGGLLGNAELLLFYGWRDFPSSLSPELYSSLHGHSAHDKTNFGGTDGELLRQYGLAWYKFAEDVIPGPAKPTNVNIVLSQNPDGVPLFPSINFGAVGTDIRYLLSEYFNAVWVKSTGLTTAIPWVEIGQTPFRYYHTVSFSFPAPLLPPNELTNVHVLLVAEYLSELSSRSTPFVFALDLSAQQPQTGSTVIVPPIEPPPPATPPPEDEDRLTPPVE